jgi:multidrug transporter EmrE-like cation transporter
MLILILTIILLSFFEFIVDNNMNAKNNNKLHLCIGNIAYKILIFLLVSALKCNNDNFTNGIWDIVSTLVKAFLTFVLFKQKFSNKFKLFGTIFIIIGTILLSYGQLSTNTQGA